MKVYIKNMVCQGTKFFVLYELERLGLNFRSFELGEIEFTKDLSMAQMIKLDESLHKYGLEIIFKNSKLVSRIRNIVIGLVEKNVNLSSSFSFYISDKVGNNYTYLNRYFTKETGLPIEEYFIEKKTEKERLNEETWSDAFRRLGISA
jgi:AraC-like DNA-binding protein